MRYLLHNHPAFPGLLSKEDLRLLVERGTLASHDLCTDIHTARDHTIGEVISGKLASRSTPALSERPFYREFRADEDHELIEGETKSFTKGIDRANNPPFSLIRAQPRDREDGTDDDESDAEEENSPSADDSEWENIYLMAHPSWLSYWKPLTLVLSLGVSAFYLRLIDDGWALMLALSGLAALIALAIARRSHDYIVTEERVEYVWGIIGRSSKEVRICDIRSLNVSEEGILGLLGLGSLEVSSASASGVEVRFKHLRRAHEVKKIIRKLQRDQSAT
jgi:hypothetical protein